MLVEGDRLAGVGTRRSGDEWRAHGDRARDDRHLVGQDRFEGIFQFVPPAARESPCPSAAQDDRRSVRGRCTCPSGSRTTASGVTGDRPGARRSARDRAGSGMEGPSPIARHRETPRPAPAPGSMPKKTIPRGPNSLGQTSQLRRIGRARSGSPGRSRRARPLAGRPTPSDVCIPPSRSFSAKTLIGPAPGPTIRSNGGSTLGTSSIPGDCPQRQAEETRSDEAGAQTHAPARRPLGSEYELFRRPRTGRASLEWPPMRHHVASIILDRSRRSRRLFASHRPLVHTAVRGNGAFRRPAAVYKRSSAAIVRPKAESGQGRIVDGTRVRTRPRSNPPGLDGDFGASARGQVGQDLSDQAGELEAVPAARAGDDDVGPPGQEIDLELLVGGDRVEADLGQVDRRVGQEGNVALEEVADDRSVFLADDRDRRCRGRFRVRRGGRP